MGGEGPTLPGVRDGGSGKVKSISGSITDDLHDIGVLEILASPYGTPEGRHFHGRIQAKVLHERVDIAGVHQGLVSLNVDEDSRVQPLSDLREPVGSRAVVQGSKHGFAAKPPDG